MSLINDYFSFYKEKIEEYGENTVILFQNGAFYEIYEKDEHYKDSEKIGNAQKISIILNNMKYTGKNFGKNTYINFIGFNVSCLDKFLPLLLNANYTVVIVNELESSSQKKINKTVGNLKRGIVKIYSPTLQPLDFDTNYNLVGLLIKFETTLKKDNLFHISLCSINNNTNDIEITEETFVFKNDNFIDLSLDELSRIVYRYFPKELQIKIIFSDNFCKEKIINKINDYFTISLNSTSIIKIIEIDIKKDNRYKSYSKIDFQNEYFQNVYKNFQMGLLTPLEYLEFNTLQNNSIINIMYTIDYISKHSLTYISNLNIPKIIKEFNYLILELNTINQLNIINDIKGTQTKPHSLFDVIDYTSTVIGKRYLKQLLCKPLKNIDEINNRYLLTKEYTFIKDSKNILSKLTDFERLHRKMGLEELHPNEFVILDKNYIEIQKLLNLISISKDQGKTESFNKLIVQLFKNNLMNQFNEYIIDYNKIFLLDEMKNFTLNTSKDSITNYFKNGIIKELDDIQNKIIKLEIDRENLRLYYDKLINTNFEKGDSLIKLEYTERDGYSFSCTKLRYENLLKKLNDNEKKELKLRNNSGSIKFFTENLSKLSYDILNNRNLLNDKIKLNYLKQMSKYYIKYNLLFNKLKEFIEIFDITSSNYFCSEKCNFVCPQIDNKEEQLNSSYFECKQLRHPIIEKLGIQYIPNDIILNNDSLGILLFGLNSSGKCHGPFTKIMMCDGSRKFAKDIIIGDKLMGDNLDYKTVISTTNGIGQMYKIIPNKGDSFECNGPHILSLKSSGYKSVVWDNKNQRYKVNWIINHINKTKSFSIKTYKTKDETYKHACLFKQNLETDKGKIIDISVEEYIKKPSIWKTNYYLYRVPVEFTTKIIFLDPYLLGYWLGDGTSKKCDITTADFEIVDYFHNILKNDGMIIEQKNIYRYSIRGKKHGDNNFRKALQYYNLINNKHIPLDYLRNNKQIRLGILAGLLDSDGYMGHGTGYDITQKNEQLLDDIIELVRSLGFSAYKSKVNKKCYNSKTQTIGIYYQCHIAGNYEQLKEIPILLHRKINSKIKTKKNEHIVSFKIQKLDISEYYGFEVDGNHRYLLNDYIVTHNSTLLRAIGINIIMAQCGLFVPCESLIYYPFSTIISQVDLTDDIFKAKSSFINEMIGLKKILSISGPNTLVLSDELCKGTELYSAISIVASSINYLLKSNTKFFFTTHLHELSKLSFDKTLHIKHLSVTIRNNNIIFDRLLKNDSGSNLYGLEVCKTILDNSEFIDNAFEIRNELIKEKTSVLSTKKSKYNSKKIINKCEICNSHENLETHHIFEQANTNDKGFIPKKGIHKNHISNLSVLCKKCHDDVTYNRIIIHGYLDSINGKFLDYEKI